MIELRDYQKKAIAQIYQQYREGKKRVVLQMQVGLGKTSVFSHIVKDFRSRRPHQRVLCVAHRVELIKQMSDRLQLMGVSNWKQYAGGEYNPKGDVHCVSVQTFNSDRYPRPDDVGLIVLDECHHYQSGNSYGEILDYYPDALVLGVTATPIRLDGGGFDDTFEAIVVGPETREMIKAGYLADYKAFAGATPDLSDVRTQHGDYKVRDLADACNDVILIGDLVDNYLNICPNKPMLVFAVNVAHSLAIVDRYIKAGIVARHIDGKTPKDERHLMLDMFKSGGIKVLSNVGVFTEGLDIPNCVTVQLARPTKSLSLYIQMVGRALRPHPDKDAAIILDHAGLVDLHGLPCDNRSWSLTGCESDRSNVVVDEKTKEFRPPNEAEQLEIIERQQIIEQQAQLVEIKKDLESKAERIVLGLIATQQSRGYKPGWVLHQLMDKYAAGLSIEHFKILGKQLGHHWRWAEYKWAEFEQQQRQVALDDAIRTIYQFPATAEKEMIAWWSALDDDAIDKKLILSKIPESRREVLAG